MADAIQHKVQAGETLSAIAKKNGITLADLLAANSDIQDPNRIQVGQLIFIPVPGTGSAPAIPAPTQPPLAPPLVAGQPMKGLDAAVNLTTQATCLKTHGFDFAIRYYNVKNSKSLPEKRLTLPEAQALVRAGLQLGAVFEEGISHSAFNHATGLAHAAVAHDLATKKIGQPAGSAIYFAVDFDATPAEVATRIKPYFEGIRDGLAAADGGTARYAVGVYGSGLVCGSLLDSGLATLTWLSQSTGFPGSKQFAKDKRYNLIQFLPKSACGIDLDPDETNPGKPSGLFTVPVT
jgi:LysM repeat protein